MRAILLFFRLMLACPLYVTSHTVMSKDSYQYPLTMQQLVQQRLDTTRYSVGGSWAPWSPWSPCTRSCGGGITSQSRQCLPFKSRRRKRYLLDSLPAAGQCVGIYKRFHVCNDQRCPAGSKDFRTVQCEEFNNKQFMGRFYSWEPFLEAPSKCELNCRAKGFRFYATLNKTVVDGTPCRGETPPPDRWLCVAGACKLVGCDGVVGSGRRPDACGSCGGDGASCRLVSGVFTRPTLAQGYNLIATLPRGACNVSVVEMRASRNYLALRRADGSFIVNGNWAINFSGDYDAFKYNREDPETITADGPLTEPVDIMVIYQAPNPGIKYEYSLPVVKRTSTSASPVPAAQLAGTQEDVPNNGGPILNSADKRSLAVPGLIGDEAAKPRTRLKRRKVTWKLTGFSQCTRSCGGGVQTTVASCVRAKDQAVVAEKRCTGLEKPPLQMVRCNVKPCPAEWVIGEWGECSATCGEGRQTRELTCQQEVTATLTMKVADGACLVPTPRVRPCHAPPCPGVPSWSAGPWTQCSSSCGAGTRTRTLTCHAPGSKEELPPDRCPDSERPPAEEPCDAGPCLPDAALWLHTEWTQQCSEECGTGVQTRKVWCSSGDACDKSTRPDRSRACSSDKHCSGQWFAGPWGQCSSDCGRGKQTRDAVCVAYVRGQYRVVLDMNCPASVKPETQRPCDGLQCSSQWYVSDWTQCSKECEQRREVRCLDAQQVASEDCPADTRPPSRRPCSLQPCSSAPGGSNETAAGDAAASDVGTTQRPSASHHKGSECTDQLPNCHMVVQARLCKYKYYHHSCCRSCRNRVQ